MFKSKLKLYFFWLIHPAAIALYFFAIILFFIPNYFHTYTAEIIDKELCSKEVMQYYKDLNHDGYLEKLICRYNGGSIASILLRDQNEQIINQWNLNGLWLSYHKEYFGDFNHNNLEEIYCINTQQDSVFLSILELMSPNPVIIKNRFISLVGLYDQNKIHLVQNGGKIMDANGDGFDDFVFVLYAGFSKFPRKAFVYDIKNDTLISSPKSASGISGDLYFFDIDNDGVEDICGRTSAHENIHYPMPYSDSSSWIMVFNPANNLNFHFPPIEYREGIGSSINTIPYNIDGQVYLASTFIYRSSEKLIDHFYLKIFNHQGELIKEKKIPLANRGVLYFINPNKASRQEFLLVDLKGNAYTADLNLHIKKQSSPSNITDFISSNQYSFLDLDKDGENEALIFGTLDSKALIIYRSNLTEAAVLEFPDNDRHGSWVLSTKEREKETLLMARSDKYIYTIAYQKNPYSLLKYPIYLAVYSILLLIFWLLQKAQNIMASRRSELEKQLIQMQLSISKKQMEPHFMLNTVNNISYLFLKDDKSKAMFYFNKFATLLRSGLLNAHETTISLEKELEFIEDYIILQKHLMDGKLEYQINIDPNIEDEKVLIPHSLIFTFVENAIKHGLSLKQKDRKLSVSIQEEQGGIKIIINDNGIGRKKSMEMGNKLYGGHISYKIIDLLGEKELALGTEVIIIL
ncbi:MAG: hypothetical protein B7C24_00495 [Bacteroidetes bacterium 4572_77]|nr:MAG: hypothetical protein B7C24_00495 [Bacteroidetes bacterium 4572_77]